MKKKTKNEMSTRQLLGISGITEYSLKTVFGETVFFAVSPSNINVLSQEDLAGKVYSLTSVLKGLTNIEILCLDSRENFEGVKTNLDRLCSIETNGVVKELLRQDMMYLDHIQASTATSRDFLLVVRICDMKAKEVMFYINRIVKTLNENGFTARHYGKDDIKTLLAVYYEQNITTEKFDDKDGLRWINGGIS